MVQDPPWAQIVLTAVSYGAPIICAVALLWPPRRDASEGLRGNGRAGLATAILCVASGALVMGFIAWFSIGMDASNRRNAAIQDARD